MTESTKGEAKGGNHLDANEDRESESRRFLNEILRVRAFLSFRNISAVYVWVALVVFFGITVPDTFLSTTTMKAVLVQEAITAILAVALVVPLSAGVYDLSIGYSLGLSSILVSWLIAKENVPVPVAVISVLAVGVVVGLINGFVVVYLRINSFIATLATSAGLSAIIQAVSDGRQIIGLPRSFTRIALGNVWGISYPVLYLLVVAIAVWYLTTYTPFGRHVYATGGNIDVARLAGVRTARVIVIALLVSAVAGAFAGVVVTAGLSTGSPTIGPSYLLPAFTAAFLGSTQIKNGEFNVWGTVLAIYVLATGVEGLQLMGAPFWLPDAFNCVALILAVGVSTPRAGGGRRRLREMRRRAEQSELEPAAHGTPMGEPQ